MSDPTPASDVAAELGLRLAQATTPAFVFAANSMTHDERCEFVLSFLAYLSGITQQAIGHTASANAFAMVAKLRPIEDTRLQ